jgi:hypothetical protein
MTRAALLVALIAGGVGVGVGVGGCTARPALRDDPDVRARGHALAAAAADAHGGLERWRAIGGARLHLHSTGPFHVYPLDSDWLLDPARNRGVARFADARGAVEWRYDGRDAVIVRDGRCAGSARDRRRAASRVSNLLYWFGTPFKFLDDGAIQRDAGGGRFLVTYRGGVGDTPDDWFLVETGAAGRVARIVYVATAATRLIEVESLWLDYRDVGDGLFLATRRVHRPKRRFWQDFAPPLVQTASVVELHVPLDDAAFAPPPGCAAAPR